MSRLRSDIFVAAYLRRCAVEGAPAVLRRRGAAEAGAILVRVDRLDGTSLLFGPAPQSELLDDSGPARLFLLRSPAAGEDEATLERRLARETRFDPDVWIVEVEDRMGRSFLDLVPT